ncbi:ATP-binding protein [soil metagenome]
MSNQLVTKFKSLTATELYQPCDPDLFTFATTNEVADTEEVIGQPRAVEAIEFGVGIEQNGYNIFALGLVGSGRHALVRRAFEQKAATEPIPPDLCYVNNFDQPYKPQALRLPPGKGSELRHDMESLVEELRTALSAAFESDEYQNRRQEIEEELNEQQEQAFTKVQNQAKEKSIALLRTPNGLVFAPMRDGQVLSPEEAQKLSDEERTVLEGEVGKLQDELQKILRQLPRAQRQARDRLQELNREIANFAVSGSMDDLREKYSTLPAVVDYLNAVQKDAIENVQDFFAAAEDHQGAQPEVGSGSPATRRSADFPALRRYQVNVLVDHSNTHGAPVVYENNPTYQNLLGRLEYMAQMGAFTTDYNLLKAGALHRANGGYLILDARDLLLQPYAWEGLKRALRVCLVQIESPNQAWGLISTVTLEPEPTPLDVKIALVGDAQLYYVLSANDPEFGQFFKVAADFADQMDRTPESQKLFAQLIAHLVRKNNLRPFDRSGVARVVEQSARMVEDASKLSTRVQSIADLLREADYWSRMNGHTTVNADDVQRALDAAAYRSDRWRERTQEAILRETILIDTVGAKVGHINGLSVIQMSSFSFGRPSRITARIQMGRGEVVDIEREVALSGPIHSKGVLILAAFLRGRYGADKPLSLSASLVFEQSYSGVEGDSASSAELYALLSAIAEVPIKQSLAVTGSVNQYGQVQAIGGANEKIEGFFDLCKARGLTGEQGVMIPASNIKHLMLRHDVVAAVEAGQFAVYAVEHIDQGIEILTGVPSGERDAMGNYPEGSINARVEKRLLAMAEKLKEFNAAPKNGNGEQAETTKHEKQKSGKKKALKTGKKKAKETSKKTAQGAAE